jgi:predicted PurR-regulated permease PerM
MKRLAWFTIAVLGTATLMLLLWQFKAEFLLFLLSLAVAAAIRPIIDYLNNRYKLSPGLASILIYTVGLIIIGALFYTISGLLLGELRRAADNFALTYELIRIQWPNGTAFQQALIERLPPPTEFYEALAGEQGVVLHQNLLGFTSGFFATIGQVFVILVLSIYWSIDRARFERLWLSLLPAEQRIGAREVWRNMEEGVGAYIRSELVQGLLAGVLLTVGYWSLGIKYPITLALVGVLFGSIPLVGAPLAATLPLLVGWSSNPSLAIAAALCTGAIFLILELVVEPHFFDRQRYSSLFMVLGMIILANDFGLLGLILAPLLVVALQILTGYLMRQSVPVAAPKPALQVTDLEGRLEEVHLMVSELDEPLPVETANMLKRLADLIKKAGQTLPPELAAEPDTSSVISTHEAERNPPNLTFSQ